MNYIRTIINYGTLAQKPKGLIAPPGMRSSIGGKRNHAYRKEMRQQAAALGLCTECTSQDPERKPQPGYRRCDVCRNRSKRYP